MCDNGQVPALLQHSVHWEETGVETALVSHEVLLDMLVAGFWPVCIGWWSRVDQENVTTANKEAIYIYVYQSWTIHPPPTTITTLEPVHWQDQHCSQTQASWLISCSEQGGLVTQQNHCINHELPQAYSPLFGKHCQQMINLQLKVRLQYCIPKLSWPGWEGLHTSMGISRVYVGRQMLKTFCCIGTPQVPVSH